MAVLDGTAVGTEFGMLRPSVSVPEEQVNTEDARSEAGW
jgi:hypothetical protein